MNDHRNRRPTIDYERTWERIAERLDTAPVAVTPSVARRRPVAAIAVAALALTAVLAVPIVRSIGSPTPHAGVVVEDPSEAPPPVAVSPAETFQERLVAHNGTYVDQPPTRASIALAGGRWDLRWSAPWAPSEVVREHDHVEVATSGAGTYGTVHLDDGRMVIETVCGRLRLTLVEQARPPSEALRAETRGAIQALVDDLVDRLGCTHA